MKTENNNNVNGSEALYLYILSFPRGEVGDLTKIAYGDGIETNDVTRLGRSNEDRQLSDAGTANGLDGKWLNDCYENRDIVAIIKGDEGITGYSNVVELGTFEDQVQVITGNQRDDILSKMWYGLYATAEAEGLTGSTTVRLANALHWGDWFSEDITIEQDGTSLKISGIVEWYNRRSENALTGDNDVVMPLMGWTESDSYWGGAMIADVTALEGEYASGYWGDQNYTDWGFKVGESTAKFETVDPSYVVNLLSDASEVKDKVNILCGVDDSTGGGTTVEFDVEYTGRTPVEGTKPAGSTVGNIIKDSNTTLAPKFEAMS